MSQPSYIDDFTRQFRLSPADTALVLVDLQYASGSRQHGLGRLLASEGRLAEAEYRFARIERLVVPNSRRLADAFRAVGAPVVYVTYGSRRPDFTGDKDWDATFALSQCAGFGLLFPPTRHLLNPSFVSARGIDNGYSPKGDGMDYPSSWNGQTPLEAHYLASVLPASQTAKDLLKNFLAIQKEDGTIDGKPGLAGQRGRYLAAPLLASLAWKLYERSEDREFLKKVFPQLHQFFWSWFSPEYDDDRDGLPQWKHILQTGCEDNPLFDAWHEWSLGINISQVHSPQLEAMLYHEAACPIKMAEQLEQDDALALLHEQAATRSRVVTK